MTGMGSLVKLIPFEVHILRRRKDLNEQGADHRW